jgi:hypothetical protein
MDTNSEVLDAKMFNLLGGITTLLEIDTVTIKDCTL